MLQVLSAVEQQGCLILACDRSQTTKSVEIKRNELHCMKKKLIEIKYLSYKIRDKKNQSLVLLVGLGSRDALNT